MAKLINLRRERSRRELKRQNALKRERETQQRIRKVSAIALMFLKRCLDLNHYNFRLAFAIGRERFILTLEHVGQGAPPPPPEEPGPGGA